MINFLVNVANICLAFYILNGLNQACVTNYNQNMGYNPNIVHASDLSEAVKIAHKSAVSGDIVTLSPACASFDAFPNFAIRGDKYKELVNSL
mgnify:CR=1 FL=1